MRVPSLLYHDVVPDQDWSASGFSGAGADVYKMDRKRFEAHLRLLASLGVAPVRAGEPVPDGGWHLTFDDGGISAATEIAPLLDRLGWKAHFFMTTGWLDAPGFLGPEELRALAVQGHVIGAHSVTHPLAMASCSHEQLEREWRESVEMLGEVLGERPMVASIPGGAFSRAVAECAGLAGIRHLFTSEPVARAWQVGPVTCYGRYTLWQSMEPAVALTCARGRGLWPLRQRLTWETRKLAKRSMGPLYLRLREWLLVRSRATADPGVLSRR